MDIEKWVAENIPKEREMKQRHWDLGFGPELFQPGETRRVDVQPKCRFICEVILSNKSNAGIHLLALYSGKEECLHLNGDSIDLGQDRIELKNIPWSDPALTISVEIVNRNKEAQKVYFDIGGRALI